MQEVTWILAICIKRDTTEKDFCCVCVAIHHRLQIHITNCKTKMYAVIFTSNTHSLSQAQQQHNTHTHTHTHTHTTHTPHTHTHAHTHTPHTQHTHTHTHHTHTHTLTQSRLSSLSVATATLHSPSHLTNSTGASTDLWQTHDYLIVHSHQHDSALTSQFCPVKPCPQMQV